MNRRTILAVALFAPCLSSGGCQDDAQGLDGLSPAELQVAAKERVRTSLGLTPESTLFATTFVGEEFKGDPVLCGTVRGTRADGTRLAPRRFIVGLESARWLMFEPIDNVALPSQPDMFAEWRTACLGEQEVR